MLKNTDRKKRTLIINEATKHLGAPYEYGAPGPISFDSSNFVKYVYKKALGITLPKITYDQMRLGTWVDKSNLLPGDLIFSFNGEHVSIYMGNNKVIHLPYKGKKVKISDLPTFYSAKRLL